MLNFSFAQTPTTIQGRVVDEQGKGITDVKVMILDLPVSTLTTLDGGFSLDPKREGKMKLIFSHPDYITRKLEVNNTRHETSFINITLKIRNPILMIIKKEITVTAEADSIADLSLPSHKTILPESVLGELGTINITESMEKVPGVAAVGKGGYSMAPSIRGLAEHRVLLLIDGIRITSERRIGPSASFVNLNDIARLEINRGPYSVFHGSGAIGGIVNIITKSPPQDKPLSGNFTMGYNTARRERAGSASLAGSLGKWGAMFSANSKKADDYQSPGDTVDWSRYSDYNLMFKINRNSRNARIYATVFHYKGTDIGKPSPSSRLKPRWYPDETNTFFIIGAHLKPKRFLDHLNANVFLFKSSLETQAENFDNETFQVTKTNLSLIENTNFGFKLRAGKSIGKTHKLNMGFDFFGQINMNDRNTEQLFDQNEKLTRETEEISLHNASRSNYGLYLDDKILLSSKLELNLGARVDFITTHSSDLPQSRLSIQDHFFSLYGGAIWQITQKISLIGNVGRSFRFPNISELYYTGLTGRGLVYGNPKLTPEMSLNIDAGIRYLHKSFFFAIYGFKNALTDMIQKYVGTADEEYFYRNLSQGQVMGVEGELYFSLAKGAELFINFHHMKGIEKDSDTALNYIPPTRLALWGKISPGGRFWLEPRLTFAWATKDPGPLEIPVDGYVLCDLITGFKVNDELTLVVIGQNLFNQTYRASADEQGVDAPGRGLVLKVRYNF